MGKSACTECGCLAIDPLLVITGSEIVCVRVIGKCGVLWLKTSINFGMAVAYMISAEQRAIDEICR